MIQLDPCPFDAGQAALEICDEELGQVRVFCRKCGAVGPYVAIEGHVETAKHKAAKQWNLRAAGSDSAGIIKRIKSLAGKRDTDDPVIKALRDAAARIERQDLELRELRGGE